MKNHTRLLSVTASAVLLFGLAACGSSASTASSEGFRSGDIAANVSYESAAAYSEDAAAEDYSYDYEYDSDYTSETADSGSSSAESTVSQITASDAKLIYTGSLDLCSTDFDKARSTLNSMVTAYGGYFSSQDIYSQDTWKEAYYTVRLPSENFNSFMNAFAENDLLKVTYQSSSVEDVTEAYTDVENRLETLQIELERLNELLKQAEDVEDMITIESEITDVEYQIESYTGTRNHYDNLISYSTVNITITETQSYDEVMEPSLGERISNAFSTGMEGFCSGCADLLVWAVANLLGILVFAVFVIVIVILVRRTMKKNRVKHIAPPNPKAPASPVQQSHPSEDEQN